MKRGQRYSGFYNVQIKPLSPRKKRRKIFQSTTKRTQMDAYRAWETKRENRLALAAFPQTPTSFSWRLQHRCKPPPLSKKGFPGLWIDRCRIHFLGNFHFPHLLLFGFPSLPHQSLGAVAIEKRKVSWPYTKTEAPRHHAPGPPTKKAMKLKSLQTQLLYP